MESPWHAEGAIWGQARSGKRRGTKRTDPGFNDKNFTYYLRFPDAFA